MAASTYLIEKIARHGDAAIRLSQELLNGNGEFAEHDQNLRLHSMPQTLSGLFFACKGTEPCRIPAKSAMRLQSELLKYSVQQTAK